MTPPNVPIQRSYRRHQQPGWPGTKAKPNTPCEFILAKIGVPSAGTNANVKPKPGDGLVYDATNNDFRLPADTEAGKVAVIGMIVVDAGTVQGSLSSIPSGANSDTEVTYSDGDHVKVGIMGTFFAIAGEAMEFGDLVAYDTGERKWMKIAPAAAAAADDYPRNPALCVSPQAVAADGLVEIRFSGPTR